MTKPTFITILNSATNFKMRTLNTNFPDDLEDTRYYRAYIFSVIVNLVCYVEILVRSAPRHLIEIVFAPIT